MSADREAFYYSAVMTEVETWLGRTVRISPDGEIGTIIAVDDTPYRPSAWVKIKENRDYPAYRSTDLADVDDVETGEAGPVWGAGSRYAGK